MSESCQKASAIDLAAFLTEPQAPQWAEFRQHLLQCAVCAAEVQRWAKLEQLLRALGKETAVTHPAEERLVQFQQSPESLPPAERHTLQQHLQGCPVCREGVARLASFDFSLLQRWVDEAQPAQPQVEEKAGAVSRLIIQLTHKGLRLLESHLAAPLLDAQELLMPLPAYRGAAGPPPALQLQLTAARSILNAIVVQDGDRIVLTLTVLGAGQEVLAGQHVFLRRQGRAVFAAQTDSTGVVRSPRLRPGRYTVACPGLELTFELEMRA